MNLDAAEHWPFERWGLRDFVSVWWRLCRVWVRHPLWPMERNGAIAIRWQEQSRRRALRRRHQRRIVMAPPALDQYCPSPQPQVNRATEVVWFTPHPHGGWYDNQSMCYT